MSRKTLGDDRRRRKTITLVWALVLAAIVITLIYREQTAILYILCTLGVTVLLVIVAKSDLAHRDQTAAEMDQSKDAASVANRIS
jgi:preprotein translocase subunit SecD